MVAWHFLLAVSALSVAVQTRPPTIKDVQLRLQNPPLVVGVGARLRLFCDEPPMETQAEWFKNGISLRARPPKISVNKERVRIKTVKLKDAGEYACRLTLEEGHRQWRNISLEVRESDPSPHSALLTARGVYGGSGSGAVPERVPGEENYSIDMDADLGGGGAKMRRLRNQTVAVGGTASFICNIPPEGDANITWFRLDGSKLLEPDEDNSLGQYSIVSRGSANSSEEELVLEDVTVEDSGWYACFVCNPYCKEWGRAWLNVAQGIWTPLSLVADMEDSHDSEGESERDQVLSPKAGSYNATEMTQKPEFTKKMNRVMAKPAGNWLRLKCPAKGNPSPNITWLINEEVPMRKYGQIRYGRWSILLEDLVTSDTGNYTCVVCNNLGCINFTYKVDIVERMLHRPILTVAPKNTTVVVGDNSSFRCTILSDLHPYQAWYLGIQNALNDSNMVKSGVDDSNPELLELFNVTYDDEGWYTCIASNSLGTTYASAYLHVVNAAELADSSMQPGRLKPQSLLVNVLVGVLCLTLILGMGVTVGIFRRLKK